MLEKGDMGVKGREMRIAINVINQGQSSLNVARLYNFSLQVMKQP